jgi:hypothetical protein
MLLMRGCYRRERLWAFRSGCKLSNLFECAVAAAGTRSDFHQRAEFGIRITAASCVANFGFDRTLEIMMLVWLYLRSPPVLTRCSNEDNFQTVTLEHFSARWNRPNSTKSPLTRSCAYSTADKSTSAADQTRAIRTNLLAKHRYPASAGLSEAGLSEYVQA